MTYSQQIRLDIFRNKSKDKRHSKLLVTSKVLKSLINEYNGEEKSLVHWQTCGLLPILDNTVKDWKIIYVDSFRISPTASCGS